MASAAAAAGCVLATTRKSVDDLLKGVGDLLADLTSQERPGAGDEAEDNEEARRLIDVELQRFWKSYYELKRRHDENALSVAVLALTKSGKSTLLNALMGMEVLPMNNVPETARICRISHDAAAREPLLREQPPHPHASSGGGSTVRGEAAVRARLQQLNNAARGGGGGPLSPQASGSLGGDGGSGGPPSATSVLHISAPLVALEGFGPEFGRVTLLDTPGPNEAGEEQLKYQVERLLEGVDCVLYLLDYTKLKTAEEEGLFRRLRAINPQLVARLSSRLFFVINKVDASETSEGLDPDEVRAYVADLVTRQLGGAATAPQSQPSQQLQAALSPAPSGSAAGLPAAPSSPLAAPGSPFSRSSSGGSGAAGAASVPFRLHPDQVLLLSARNALLARLVLSGRAGPDATRRFMRLAFGAFGLGFGGAGMGVGMAAGRGGGAAAGPSPEQVRSAAGCLLEGSGVLELEGRVLAFLAAHAGSVKMLATADDTARLLAEVRNVALACRSCLQRNVEALAGQAEALRTELAGAGAAFEEVRERADAVQAEVVAEIKTHLNSLRRRLFTQIIQTLDTDARAPPPAAAAAATTAAAAPSFWPRVREKFLSMFTAASFGLPPPAAAAAAAPHGGPSLVPEARSRSREEMEALLLDLHDDVMGQIHSEVYDFWGVLEACAASRHAELLSALNRHLAALSRRVEGCVAEALGVTLAPADIRLRPPSAEQLHSDVQELIEKGIRESSEKHIRVGTRTTRERVLRTPEGPPSLCRWGAYWVETPRTRTVVETYTATVYSLKPDEITNHFIGLVDGAISTSERALGSYVAEMVDRQLAAARERIRDYSDRYLGAMNAALAASSRGAACRGAALAAVEGYLARLEQLAAAAGAAQAAAEAAVPGGATALIDEVEVYDDDDEEYGREYGSGGGAAEADAAQVAEPEAADGEVGGAEAAAGLEEAGEAPTTADDGTAAAMAAALETMTPFAAAAAAAAEADDEGFSAAAAGDPKAPVAAAATPQEAEEAEEAAVAMEAEELPAAVVSLSVIPDIDDMVGSDAVERTAGDDAPTPFAVEAGDSDGEASGSEASEGKAGDTVGGGAVASLQALAGAAVESAAVRQEPLQQRAAASSAGHAAVVPASGPAASMAPFSAVPFDYSRAFLEAMSSSDMAAAGMALRPDPAEPSQADTDVLTMIPLVSDGGIGGEAGGWRGSGGGGLDSPRSGASEDWQLVEEGAGLSGEEAEAEAQRAGKAK